MMEVDDGSTRKRASVDNQSNDSLDVSTKKAKSGNAAADPTDAEDVDMVDSIETVKKAKSVFDTERLKVYYLSLFPYKQMFSWLSYGNDPSKAAENPAIDKDFFYRREFSFTMEHDVYIRYLSFRNAEEMEREIQKKQPHKIDIGAVYSLPAMQHNSVQASAFKPLERELVFDIDLTDYDDVRVGCTKDMMWENGSWQYMSLAIKIVDAALREDFGFENLLWVFSGRRGVHCWVCDKRALQLEDRERTAVVNYLTLLSSEDPTKIAAGLTSPLHPSLKRAMPMMEAMFEDMVCSPKGQDLLADPERWQKVLKMIPDAEIQSDMHDAWQKSSKQTSLQRWKSLKATVASRADKKGKGGWSLRRALQVIVVAYTYPRLDVNVSTHRNHLLKSPFVVHPKTGKVCVPIFDVADCHNFDPDTVPNLDTLMDELDNSLNDDQETYKRTSMKPYIDGFEKKFLKPLYAAIRKTQIDHKQQQAAVTGDW